VFELNLPVGIVAGLIIWFALQEKAERHPQRIDWLGAAILTAGVVTLLVAVSEGGDLFGWVSPQVAVMLAVAFGLLAWFARHARRTPDPLVDLDLLKAPVIRAGLLVGTLAGIVMFGVTTYVPPMVQGVHGGSPLEAGVAVAAMSIGWPLASVFAGRLLARVGARPLVIAGTSMLVVGALLVTQLDRIDALWFAALGCAVTGVGMGLSSTTLLVIIQGSVAWGRRAVATGLVQFSRTIGGAVGVGLMGGILAAFVGAASSAILDPFQRGSLSAAELGAGRADLASGLTVTYWLMAAAAVAAWVVAVRTMPDARLGHQVADARPRPEAPAA
jgi:predicted MFS family arabinose efflux permease